MSDREFDAEMEQQMMDGISEDMDPVEKGTKVHENIDKTPAWKERLLALKKAGIPLTSPEGNGSVMGAKQDEKIVEAPASAKLIVRGDPGSPQNQLEADTEADRMVGRAAIDASLENETQQILNAEAMFIETVANESHDKERFKRVFIDIIQQRFLGKTLDETEDIIRDMHETLFDLRTGIQAGMEFRKQLLKDVDADKRAERLRKDWLYKSPKKEAKAKSTSSTSSKAPKKTMFETMRDSMMAFKNISKEEAEKRLKAKGYEP